MKLKCINCGNHLVHHSYDDWVYCAKCDTNWFPDEEPDEDEEEGEDE